MGIGFGEMILMALLMGQGGVSDVLDVMDATDYWKAQKVEMTLDKMAAEIQPTKDAAGGQAASVRRLMAVRALGEMKKKEALPLLQPLLKDQTLFVADYAKAAIAAIEGKPYQRAGASPEQMASDVALLPKGCGVVAQMTVPGGSPVSYEKMLQMVLKMNPEAQPKPEEAEKGTAEVTDGLINFTSRVGNFRIHGLTVGVAGDVGDQSGFVVIVARGVYDSAAVRAALKPLATEGIEKVDDIEVFRVENDQAYACPSDDRLIFFAGPNRNVMPLEEVLDALKTGKGGITGDADIKELLASVDHAKGLWAVARMTDTYKQAPLLAPIDTMTLTTDVKEDATTFTLVAKGADADKIKDSVDMFETGRKEMIANMKDGMPPPMQVLMAGVFDFLEGVQVQNDGTTVTVTSAMKGGPDAVLKMAFLAFFDAMH